MLLRRSLPLLVLLAAACSNPSGVGTGDPPALEKVDPYAVIYVENLTTPAAGKLHTRYVLTAVLQPGSGDYRTTVETANQGAVAPGEAHCMSIFGYVASQQMAMVGVADTSADAATRPDTQLQAAALPGAILWDGAVLATTGIFDPLVSVLDPSIGSTPQHPVKWRWTISDAGRTLREDATVPCKHTLDPTI
jgi:hypothetical protein